MQKVWVSWKFLQRLDQWGFRILSGDSLIGLFIFKLNWIVSTFENKRYIDVRQLTLEAFTSVLEEVSSGSELHTC